MAAAYSKKSIQFNHYDSLVLRVVMPKRQRNVA